MFITNFKRIIKTGFVNFLRSGTISFSVVFVMVITLSTIIFLLLSNTLLSSAIAQIQDKIDVNVYLAPTASVEDILILKDSVSLLPEVSQIEYISREQALANFRERHRNDNLTLQALEELDENPLGAVLNIKAKEVSQYAGIAKFLEMESALSKNGQATIIEKVNYYNNKIAIDKLSKITSAVKSFGFALAVLLMLASVLIAYNTIRLTIFIAREEIKVMRLVGANNNYIRGPFLFVGALYGAVSAVVALLLFYPILFWVNPFIEQMFFLDLLAYYFSHSFSLLGITLLIGIFLGIVSSALATRKYLQI